MSSGGGGARVRVAREGTDTERHILPGVVPPQEALDILSVIQKLPKRPDSGEPCWAVVGNLVRRDWRTCRRVWLAAQEGQGLHPKPTGGQLCSPPTLQGMHLAYLQALSESFPDLYLSELVAATKEDLGVEALSESQMHRAFVDVLERTLKLKTRVARNKFSVENMAAYTFFCKLRREMTGRRNIVFVDEMGTKLLELRRHLARAPRGMPVVEVGPGERTQGKRQDWAFAMDYMGVLNCVRPSQGNRDSAQFEEWVFGKDGLLEEIEKRHPDGASICIDNAPIHREVISDALEVINAAGRGPFDVFFTPAHSPECNPIELFFSWVKSKSKGLYGVRDEEDVRNVVYAASQMATQEMCSKWIESCGFVL